METKPTSTQPEKTKHDESHVEKKDETQPQKKSQDNSTHTGVKEYQFDDTKVTDSRHAEDQIENNPAVPVQPRKNQGDMPAHVRANS